MRHQNLGHRQSGSDWVQHQPLSYQQVPRADLSTPQSSQIFNKGAVVVRVYSTTLVLCC